VNTSDRRKALTNAAFRCVPAGLVVSSAWAITWDVSGSIEARDWLPYAVGCALVLAVVLVAGGAVGPSRLAVGAALGLVGLAVWQAISISWSPVPSLARDEAIVTALYALVFLTGVLVVRSERERVAATAVVVLGLSALAVATALELRLADRPQELFARGRLSFPISYVNAEAAVSLIAFWPAIALAAGRNLPVLLRGAALGGATAMAGVWVMVQSKGAGVALAASAAVFFAVAPSRVRALVPVLIVAIFVGAAAVSLTEPYRVDGNALAAAVDDAGSLTLWLALGATAVGVAYAALDARLRMPARAHRLAGRAALATVVAAAICGVVVFVVRVDSPGGFVSDRWESFKSLPAERTTASHFSSLGSNRYDFWRVALDEAGSHPLGGIGARGWSVAYLREGRSVETPERAHSLEMDVLSETGVVGLLLLLVGGALGLAAVARRGRASVLDASLVAVAAYWTVHTAGDWVWTFPAVGLPAFCLLGIGASSDRPRPLPARIGVPAGVLVAAVAVVGFAPPWLSARFTDRAYERPASAADDLRWARRLDPLSTDPLVAEAALATSPANIPPLERAVRKQPRREDLRYLLGVAYLDAGRTSAGRRELQEALRLYPGDDLARQALERAR
jgi:hypothetical protein